MNNIKTLNQNNNISFSSDSNEDEVILNEDDFGTIGDLHKDNDRSKNNNNELKQKLNNLNYININKEIVTNENLVNNSQSKNIQTSIPNSRFLTENSKVDIKSGIKDKDKTNCQLKKLRSDLTSDKDKILITNDNKDNHLARNNSQLVIKNLKTSKLKTNKTVFSKIAENLYDSNITKSNNKNNLNGINEKENDYYDRLTAENYIISYAIKANCDNHKAIERFIERNTKNNIIDKQGFLDLKNLIIPQGFEGDNNNDYYSVKKRVNTEKKISRKNKSPDEFLLNQQKSEILKKLHLDNLKLIQNNLSKATIKDRPTINKFSEKILTKRTYNNIKGVKEKNIHIKLYEDFTQRKKNMEKLQRNSFSYNAVSKKKISPDEIKKITNRLYNEYIQKDQKLKDSKEKKIIYYRNLSSMPLINKKSDNIISNRFITKYKLILSSSFNKNINDIFDINYKEYISLIKQLGMINPFYSENNNEEGEKKDFKNNSNVIIEFKAISEIWKEHNNLKFDNNNNKCQNCENESKCKIEIKNDNKNNDIINFSGGKILNLKRKSENKNYNSNKNIKNNTEKLIKESWKIITNSKNFNKELYANSHNVLLFLLSVLGIFKNDINNIVQKEFSFLLPLKNKTDNNFISNIYKNFATFRTFYVSNLATKKRLSANSTNNLDKSKKITKYIVKNRIIKNQPKRITESPGEINSKVEQKILPQKTSNKNYLILKTIFTKKKTQKKKTNEIAKISKTEIYDKKEHENNALNEITKNYKNKRNINQINKLNDIEINNSNEKNTSKIKVLNTSNISNDKKTASEDVNSFCSSFKKKKFKFVFQIKIGEENKKLIINENQNIKEEIDQFCLENKLDEYEKEQIIEVVNRKFSQRQIKNKY